MRVARRPILAIGRGFLGRARVAELVDALDLGSSIARCGGSSPSARTMSTRRLSRGLPALGHWQDPGPPPAKR